MTATAHHLRHSTCCATDWTASAEDYLKTIFALTAAGQSASTSGIAERMGVTPSSTSTMVARLRQAGLVEQAGWGHVLLTTHGMAHARSIVRRHRLLETLLHRVLGLDWDEVHDEAEILEHALSERLTDRIDAVLGHPDRDPHGDPIPAKFGPHNEVDDDPLRGAPAGATFVVRRVVDRDRSVLRRLAAVGVRPGVVLDVPAALDADLVDAVRGVVVSDPDGSAGA